MASVNARAASSCFPSRMAAHPFLPAINRLGAAPQRRLGAEQRLFSCKSHDSLIDP